MSDDFIGFGKGDDNFGKYNKAYKGEADTTDRLSMVWLYKDEKGNYSIGPDATPKFKSSLYHYVEGIGNFESTGEFTTSRFGAPKRKIGTFIVKYRTSKKGELPVDSNNQPIIETEVLEWKFGEDKFSSLKAIHSEFNLTMHDFKATCTDKGFQKMTFTACNGAPMWHRDKELMRSVLTEVAALEGKFSLARTLTNDEIRQKLGESDAVAVPSASEPINYSDLMSDLG